MLGIFNENVCHPLMYNMTMLKKGLSFDGNLKKSKQQKLNMVSDCCLTPSVQFFSYIMVRTSNS